MENEKQNYYNVYLQKPKLQKKAKNEAITGKRKRQSYKKTKLQF